DKQARPRGTGRASRGPDGFCLPSGLTPPADRRRGAWTNQDWRDSSSSIPCRPPASDPRHRNSATDDVTGPASTSRLNFLISTWPIPHPSATLGPIWLANDQIGVEYLEFTR